MAESFIEKGRALSPLMESRSLASPEKSMAMKMIYGESMWLQMPALAPILGLTEADAWLKTGDVPALSAMGMNAGSSTIGIKRV